MSVTSSVRPIWRRGRSTTASAAAHVLVGRGSRAARSASTSAPRSLPDLDQEAVPAVVEQLGQREVEARRSRAGRSPSRRRSTCRPPGRS